MNDVAILDFNMGNLFSIKCALNYVGLKSVVTDDFETIKNSKCLIIPGVGAFPEAMKRLKEKNSIVQYMILITKVKLSLVFA